MCKSLMRPKVAAPAPAAPAPVAPVAPPPAPAQMPTSIGVPGGAAPGRKSLRGAFRSGLMLGRGVQ